MTNESAIFIELKIVFGEIQPLLENNFSLFQIHRKKPYPLLIVKCYAGFPLKKNVFFCFVSCCCRRIFINMNYKFACTSIKE